MTGPSDSEPPEVRAGPRAGETRTDASSASGSRATESHVAAASGESDPRLSFVLRIGRALHTYGYPAHRLEELMAQVSRHLGLTGQFFSQPTSIFAAFGAEEKQRTYLMRVEPGEVHLEKLALLDGVVSRVLSGASTPGEGGERVDAIVAAPPRYGPALTALAFGVSSGAASRFLGGGAAEVGVAAGIGAVIGVMALLAERAPASRRVFQPLAAFAASALAAAASLAFGPCSVYIATLAGLIVLLPGLTLTTAMTELSSGHLASGTARLSGATMVFLGIAFGVALGGKVSELLLGAARVADPIALPAWTELAALLVAPVSLMVLLRAPPRDLPWILATGVLAFSGGRLGARLLGPELGIFAGALTAGLASNLYARLLDRPSAVTLVPAILLLVPGSIGFRSLVALLNREIVPGM